MEVLRTRSIVEKVWDDSIIPRLMDYIQIPNRSPASDPEWNENGLLDRAAALIEQWCLLQPIEGLKVETVQIEGRTPLIFMEIPSDSRDCVLLYGHLDKQPALDDWREGLGPYTPVVEGERLYGRGGADDGYAAFAALTAIRALREQKVPHARCVVLIEACEESGSFDLPYYIEALAERIGSPSLVIALDSGCGNYEQLWSTTSLRGTIMGDLVVEVLTEGVHSGDASGIVPSSFRILGQLLSRLEDVNTGEILPPQFHVEIPAQRLEQAASAAKLLGTETYAKFPFIEGARPVSLDAAELILNRTWRPALSITGAAGLPAPEDAANVMRPMTALKLSLRVPPTCDVAAAVNELKVLFEKNPPYGARVRFESVHSAAGWDAPELDPWLRESLDRASISFFGREAAFMGEGGSITFMAMLGEIFPEAQFVITGVLGPNSNAHGPNEFLHIPTGKRLTCCVAQIIADHYRRP